MLTTYCILWYNDFVIDFCAFSQFGNADIFSGLYNRRSITDGDIINPTAYVVLAVKIATGLYTKSRYYCTLLGSVDCGFYIFFYIDIKPIFL